MKSTLLALVPLAIFGTAAMAQSSGNPYRYSGPHAGGPADDLIPSGKPVAREHHPTSPAYRYSGQHAGGPADDRIPAGKPRAVVRPEKAPAYRYSGSHAGGPANDVARR